MLNQAYYIQFHLFLKPNRVHLFSNILNDSVKKKR